MIRATRVLSSGQWSQEAADTVVLDFDARHRRRVAMTGEGGTAFLLDLAEATALKHGDGLILEDGRIVAVRAAPEPLSEVTAADANHLLRLAWHIGNRHLPAQLLETRILLRRDHVIEDMLRGLGGTVTPVEAPFDPEGGAYSHGHDHGHGHEEDDGHHHHHHHDHG